jgi:hypothetical protein
MEEEMSDWFQNRQKQSLVILLLLVAGIIYTSTRGSDPESPEGQVRKAINELVEAAEQRDLDPFRKHLSEDVQDEQGRGKQDLLNTLRMIFIRHQKISLSLLNLNVDNNTNPDIISASLTLLMGDTAIPTDKGNFFLTFRREGDTWKVWEVEWGTGYGI